MIPSTLEETICSNMVCWGLRSKNALMGSEKSQFRKIGRVPTKVNFCTKSHSYEMLKMIDTAVSQHTQTKITSAQVLRADLGPGSNPMDLTMKLTDASTLNSLSSFCSQKVILLISCYVRTYTSIKITIPISS